MTRSSAVVTPRYRGKRGYSARHFERLHNAGTGNVDDRTPEQRRACEVAIVRDELRRARERGEQRFIDALENLLRATYKVEP